MPQIRIIHTNDSHGRFGPEPGGAPSPSAEALRALLREHPGAVYLDAGDTVSAGNLAFRPGGEPALEVLSDLGCRAMCLGNRESHPRKEIFPKKLDRARFPVLCANVQAKGEAPLPVRPHIIIPLAEVKIGVFGVTVPMFTKKQWSQPLCDYWFSDPLEAARRQIELLRAYVDVLVAVTHIGFKQDLALAAACPELDLVIGGHSHTELDEPHRVEGVPVVQARSHGFLAGVAALEVADGRGRLVMWEKRRLRAEIPA